jgi:ACT domain-containing protein
MQWPSAHRFVQELEPDARKDLLKVLTSPSNVRAEVIRQFHERGRKDMTELLILLEENEWARQAIIEELQEAGD